MRVYVLITVLYVVLINTYFCINLPETSLHYYYFITPKHTNTLKLLSFLILTLIFLTICPNSDINH